MFLRFFLTFIIIFSITACSKKNDEVYKQLEKENPYELYKEGLDAFEKRQYFFAEKKFSQAELIFEDVELAAKSSIMSSFSLYGINFYDQALNNLESYLKRYPLDKNIVYAHYLISIIYFEQITDEKKDLEPLLKAEKQINFFLKKYPNTDYAIDLRFKKDLIQNQLAAKELFVARYYISLQKWVPAINRLKNIINKYDKTVFVEEALHRLVEIHFHIGLEKEAESYAKILGYNYNSSKWFEQSYLILNKDYKIQKKEQFKKDNDGLLKKILKKII